MVNLTGSLAMVAREVGERVAGPAADAVDREARFPHEAMDEIRRVGLLGALVPSHLGGPGASVSELAEAVAALAEHCASSALILAMHGIQVACLVRHAEAGTLERVVPGLLSGELLLANANSEVGLGGDRRTSICALESTPDGYRLEKHASTVSYGEYADGVLATARRDAQAPGHDQVFAVCLKPDFGLEAAGAWDTLGMRGTCSRPFVLTASVPQELVVDNYAEVFSRTTLPVSAILLGSVWLGIAEAAARHAHSAVRASARRSGAGTRAADTPPPTNALRLAELAVVLHELRSVLAGAGRDWEEFKDSPALETLGFSSRMDYVKVSATGRTVDIVQRAMGICGLAGYDNTSPLSLGRLARDAAAGPLMVGNDRVLSAVAGSLLVRKNL